MATIIKIVYDVTNPVIKVTYDVTNITIGGSEIAPVYISLDYSSSSAVTVITSVGLTMPTGFSVANSPLTQSGTLGVTYAAGYSLPTITKQSEWDQAYNDKINSASVTGTTTKTLTLNQQDGGTIQASWSDIDTGLTSVGLSVPTGLTVTNSPLTTNGTIAVGLASGYSIPTTASQSTWDAAYNDKINSAAVTGTTTKTLTLNQQNGGTIQASWTDDNTDAVTSVFGRTGTIVATEGDYNLTQLGDVTLTSPTTGQVLKYNGTTWVNNTDTDTGLTSVGLSMPSAFAVSNSPLTSNGTIAVTGAGTSAQYVRGDGQLANFPSTGGGGSSVNYYLNGSVSQGTFGGDTYYEMSKTPIIGAGTNFTRTNAQGNGYIASFITDAADPALLNIPGGNWNVEFYFQASSGGGNPSFYAELYKVSSANVFTLIASGSTNPEGITNGTAVDEYYTSIPVPQTALLATDRIAIRIFVTPSGRTITLHTEDNNLCEVITTFSTGLNALNGLTDQVQYFATGTSGTDFAISSATDTHTFNLPIASGTNTGKLSNTDWTTFINKQNAITLTTFNASGSATFVSSVLNIPTYTLVGLGGEPAITPGASTQYFRGDKTFQTLDTSVVPENSNLYYTDTRARNAITLTTSGSSGASTYSGGTLNVPTYTLAGLGGQPQLNGTGFVKANGTTITYDNSTYYLASNPNAYITLSSISESATGLEYNNTTGVFSLTSGYVIPTTSSATNWDAAYNDKINSAAVTGTTTKTLTLTQQDGGTITASWTDDNTDAVASVFGRTGAVVAVSGDYTTAQVTESGNLYYTDARARASITLTTTGSSGAATYSGGTLNIPSYSVAGLGAVPDSRTITVNGQVFDLSANRNFEVGDYGTF